MSVEATQKQPDNGSMNQNLGWKVNKIFFKKYLLSFHIVFLCQLHHPISDFRSME